MVREVLNGQTLGGAALRSHEGRVVCSWGPRGETAWWADGRPALEQDFDGEEEMERRIVELRAELGRLQQSRYAREREAYEQGILSKPTVGGVAHGSPLQCKSIDRNISMYSWDPINNTTPDDEHYSLTVPDAPDPVKDPRLRKHWSNRSEKLADEIDFLFQQLTKEREANNRGDSLMGGLPKNSPTYEKQKLLESEGWQFSEELEEDYEVFGRLVASDRRMDVRDLDDRSYDLVIDAAREDIAELFDFNLKHVDIDKLQNTPFAVCFSLHSRNIDAIPLAERCRHMLKQAHTQPNYHILKLRRTSETFFRETRRKDDETWYSSTIDAGASSIGNPRPATYSRIEGYSHPKKTIEPPHKLGTVPPAAAGSFTAVKSPPKSTMSPQGSIVAEGSFKSPPKATRAHSKSPPSPQYTGDSPVVVSSIDMKDFRRADPDFGDYNFPTPPSMRSSPLGRSRGSSKKRSSSSKSDKKKSKSSSSGSSKGGKSPIEKIVNDFVSPPTGFSTRMPSTKVPVPPPDSPRMTKSPTKSKARSRSKPPSTSYYRSGSKPPAPFTKVPAGAHLVE